MFVVLKMCVNQKILFFQKKKMRNGHENIENEEESGIGGGVKLPHVNHHHLIQAYQKKNNLKNKNEKMKNKELLTVKYNRGGGGGGGGGGPVINPKIGHTINCFNSNNEQVRTFLFFLRFLLYCLFSFLLRRYFLFSFFSITLYLSLSL